MSAGQPRLDDACHALRGLMPTDALAWYEYLRRDDVTRDTSWTRVTPQRVAELIAGYGGPQGPWRWAIARRADDALEGTIGFNEVALEHGRAELAFDLSPAAWGQGLATRAAQAVLRWAFQERGLQRVQATVLDTNLRSRAVLERLGMRCEGTLSGYRIVRGAPRDFLMYALRA